MSVDLTLRRARKDVLIRALLDCRPMQSAQGRSAILEDLREDFRAVVDGIPIAADNLFHTRNIVAAFAACGDWAAVIDRVLFYEGGTDAATRLSELRLEFEQQLFEQKHIDRLRKYVRDVSVETGPEILRCFDECAHSLNVPAHAAEGSPYSLLLTLAAFPPQAVGFPVPALKFAQAIGRLFPANTAKALRDLILEVAPQHGVARTRIEELLKTPAANAGKEVVLIFGVNPKAAGSFLLSAWLRDCNHQWTQLPTDDFPVSEDAAREKFCEVVALAERQSTNLLIEIALPREMFASPMEQWEIALGKRKFVVGAQYPVVLRWLNRLREDALEPRWREKWQSLEEHSGEPLWLTRTDEYRPLQLLAILSEAPAKGAYISFAFAPPGAVDGDDDPLSIALSGGTPIAVWCRECDPDPAKAREKLQALLKDKSLTDLPSILRGIRNQAVQEANPLHLGHHIAMLYDNPDHRPPQLAVQR